MMDMMMGGSMGGSMGASSGGAMAGMGSGAMTGAGTDAMGMMMNRMDMMMNKVDMMMSGGGMAPTAYGQGMGYMQQAPGYAGQAYGYMQAPAAQGGSAAHGAATGILGTPGALNLTSLLTGILSFAIAIFAILLVVGLVIGTIVFLKRLLLGDYGTVVAARPVGNTCTHCGTGLTQSFNFCPACGERKASSVPLTTTSPVTA